MKQIKTRLCDCLNLTTPLFQAPMAGAITPQLASAVANYAGQSAGLVHNKKYTHEILEEIVGDAIKCINACYTLVI